MGGGCGLVSKSYLTVATSWTVTLQSALSMGLETLLGNEAREVPEYTV